MEQEMEEVEKREANKNRKFQRTCDNPDSGVYSAGATGVNLVVHSRGDSTGAGGAPESEPDESENKIFRRGKVVV